MQNVVVTNYTWTTNGDDIITLDFTVYKKGLFGRVKPDRNFDGWGLVFKQLSNSEIDIDSLVIQDGNIRGVPLIPHLAHAVLLAGANTLKKAGEIEEASLLQKASRTFFKKYILKQ